MSRPLQDGFTPIPPGKVAAIVTNLQMTQPPAAAGGSDAGGPDADWLFERVEAPSVDWYEDLFRRIGAAHLWYSRLAIDRQALAAILSHRDHVIHALTVDGVAQGIVEMDFREHRSVEIVFFGVTPTLIGTRAARFMMTRAIAIAFSRDIDKLWLHTNTLDHPKAMAFYRRSGFTPVGQMVEIADDPRLTGMFPMETAPQIPIFRAR